jgi:hypothetical protein
MATENSDRSTEDEEQRLRQERVRKLAQSGKSLGEIAAQIARDRASVGTPDLQIPHLDMDTAIRFRWALRDIKGKRTKLTPVSPGDLKTLIQMGFVEIREELPILTNEGERAIN